MKFICESAEESSTLNAKHEPLADLNEDICDLLWLRMYFGDAAGVLLIPSPKALVTVIVLQRVNELKAVQKLPDVVERLLDKYVQQLEEKK